MKTEILKFLNEDRSFDKGRELYMKHGNKMGFKRVLNSRPADKELHETLLHELAQMAEIDNKLFHMIMNRPVMVIKAQVDEEPVEEIKDVVPDPALVEEKKKVVTGMKAVLKLREEFPFLNEANCPEEFKILVADKYSSFIRFKEGHEDLFKAENEDDLLTADIKTVENVLENQSIWDELDHYNKTGEILGKHAIFTREDLRAKYMAMAIPDLILARENCKKRISALNTEIAKNAKPEKLHDKQENLKAKEDELNILNKLLGFKENPIEPVEAVSQKTDIPADVTEKSEVAIPPIDSPEEKKVSEKVVDKTAKKSSQDKVVQNKTVKKNSEKVKDPKNQTKATKKK
jgi:hypothetical protein